MTTPPLPLAPPCDWPVEAALCCPGWDDYPAEVAARAERLAVVTLWALTGRRYGPCPTTVRPCRRGCTPGSWGAWSGGTFTPTLYQGGWVNVPCGGCGAHPCSCTTVCEVDLPGPVAAVLDVTLSGASLDPGAYRVDDWHHLVRTDGECWPTCQDMAAPADGEGAFAVTYTLGLPVPAEGVAAAGVLACEFASACSGGDCRLPSGWVSVARSGVSISREPGTGYLDGLTGIPEVDAWVTAVNPHRLPAASTVTIPGRRRVRTTTWTAP